MLKALRPGVIVRTVGGLRGEIVSITDEEATLLIADKVKVNVLRGKIESVEPTAAEKAAAKEKAKEAKEKAEAKDQDKKKSDESKSTVGSDKADSAAR